MLSRSSGLTLALLFCTFATGIIYWMASRMSQLQSRQDYQTCQNCIIVMGIWDLVSFLVALHCFFDSPKRPPKIQRRKESSPQELDEKKDFDSIA